MIFPWPFVLASFVSGLLCYSFEKASGLAARTLPRFPSTVFDSGVHGGVAVVTWWLGEALLLFTSANQHFGAGSSASYWWGFLPPGGFMSLSCGIIAVALDLDHFIAARSLRFGDAMTLSSRPFGHAVAFVVLVCLSCYAVPQLRPWWFVVAVAWGTHHLRDSIRRGLWFWPLGSTPPIPFEAYIAAMALTPLLVAFVLGLQRSDAAAAMLQQRPLTGSERFVAVEVDGHKQTL